MMKAVLGRALCRTAYHSGALSGAMRLTEPLNARAADGRFQILVYHRVGNDVDPYLPGTTVAAFERHMRYLHDHFRILSLSELLSAARRGTVPGRAVAVTFDDGYEDTYIHAYPIVRRYQIPITVYLATGFIDDGCAMWNDRVGVAIRDTLRDRLDAIPGHGSLPLTTPVERLRALEETLGILKRRPAAERDELTAAIIRALEVPDERAPRMLCWPQVEEMHAHGAEFGAHTVHHAILTAIPADEAWREIVESKQMIEERLHTPAVHFAYPNGTVRDFDAGTKSLVRKAGFASAVSMVAGTNTAGTDMYELRRESPWEEDTALFAARLWWYRMRGNAGGGGTDGNEMVTGSNG
jgi:peptidoglycan/xylan/chitin deacetylase (PgdA/CDA1 family)